MIASMIRRTVVADQAYAAIDIDSPGDTAVAVAWKAPDGWRVGSGDGRTVAEKLTKTVALNVMHREASRVLDLAATRSLLAALR
jgi:hypothetical protein